MKSPISPTIGILAATGPRSITPFIDLIVSECQSQYGARHDTDFPKMLICAQPMPGHEDRPVERDAVEEALRNGLRQLERAGADFLAIACDTAHTSDPRLAESVGVRVLNPVDLMLEAIPLSAQKLALAAARPAIESEVFQHALWRSGHKLVDLDWQQEIDTLIAAARTSPGTSLDSCACAQRWAALTARAEEAGIDTLLVSCFDLHGSIRHGDTALHIVDVAHCLARGIVAEWLAWCVQD